MSAGRFEDRAEASDDLVSTLPVNLLEKDPFSGYPAPSTAASILFLYSQAGLLLLLLLGSSSPIGC